MKIWIYLFPAFLIFTNCKQESTPKKQVQLAAQSILTQNEIQDLVTKVDFVDFLFYHMNISVSQNDPASIQQSLHFLTTEAKPATMQCASIGRASFQSKGKIIFEADMHFADHCGYFTIIENKVAKGTCLMSPDGVKFLSTMINSYQNK
ncbi:MAG: hypothetical protein ABI761_00580 [Saprospiraceae bacterium]